MKGNRKAESLFECFVQMSYSYKRPKPLKVTNYWNFRFCVEFKMLKNRKNTLHWNNLSRQTFCHFTIVSIGIPNKSSIFWKRERRDDCVVMSLMTLAMGIPLVERLLRIHGIFHNSSSSPFIFSPPSSWTSQMKFCHSFFIHLLADEACGHALGQNTRV